MESAAQPPEPLLQASAEFTAGQMLTTSLVRDYISKLQARLEHMFYAGESAEQISQYRCDRIDNLIDLVWKQTIDDPNLSLVAVGGYGRGELQPGSDIDLLILADKQNQLRRSDAPIRKFITLLWDMGLDVGQSVRTISECVTEARNDITVITALIEIRDLCGKPRVTELQRRLSVRKLWPSSKFFAAKLAEQQQRHQNFGESGYLLEPNIKESPGGLRDLQTIGWIAKRHYQVPTARDLIKLGFLDTDELETMTRNRNLLWGIRTGLHLLSHRKDDQLMFAQQRELARLAGYQDSDDTLAVEAFMKSYYRAIMELRRINEMLMARLREEILPGWRKHRVRPLNDRFQVRNQYLEVIDEHLFARQPEAMVELFVLLARHRDIIEGVQAATIRLIHQHLYLIDEQFRQAPAGNQLFLELLREPRGVAEELRRMARYGVLGALFPDFHRVTGQMQHDLFHVYTVDEHTLLCVRNALRFASAEASSKLPECHDIYLTLPKPELLVLAALTHDIGKGLGGNHSQLGAEIAQRFCHQLGLPATDTDTITWLVNTHLDMSSLSQNADISDAEVIARFASHVDNLTNLDTLYLLTIADMQATGPSVWNSWKGSLLNQLYQATRQQLQSATEPAVTTSPASRFKDQAIALLPGEGVTLAQAETLWTRLDDSYFRRFTPAEIAWHAKNIIPVLDTADARVVATRNFPDRGGTGVFVYTADHPNLFAAIVNELDRRNLEVVDARILTSSDDFVLDAFMVLDNAGKAISQDYQRQEIRHAIRKELAADQLMLRPSQRRADRRSKAFRFAPVVRFEAARSASTWLLELTTSNQPGLLATVATILSNHAVPILNARINTYGERVQDQFTLTLPRLDPADTETLLQELRSELTQALSPEKDVQAAPITMDKQF